MTTAFYPITNKSTAVSDGYFEIPGNFTAMFEIGFDFVAIDSGSGSPPISSHSTFTVADTSYTSGRTRIYPAFGSPIGSPLTVGSPVPSLPTPNGEWVTLAGGAYSLDFSDPTNGTLVVSVASTNTETSLKFPGRASFNYGESLNENFLHLLENFSYSTPPINPIQGQLWYDNNTLTLMVCEDDSSPVTWTSVAGSGITLSDLTDVSFSSSPLSIGDVLTWNGSEWDAQPTGSGSEDGVNYDEIIVSGSPISNIVNTTNVTTTANTGTTSYIQVFLNGILQREGGNYNVTGINQITFTITLNNNDEILIYQL